MSPCEECGEMAPGEHCEDYCSPHWIWGIIGWLVIVLCVISCGNAIIRKHEAKKQEQVEVLRRIQRIEVKLSAKEKT